MKNSEILNLNEGFIFIHLYFLHKLLTKQMQNLHYLFS